MISPTSSPLLAGGARHQRLRRHRRRRRGGSAIHACFVAVRSGWCVLEWFEYLGLLRTFLSAISTRPRLDRNFLSTAKHSSINHSDRATNSHKSLTPAMPVSAAPQALAPALAPLPRGVTTPPLLCAFTTKPADPKRQPFASSALSEIS